MSISSSGDFSNSNELKPTETSDSIKNNETQSRLHSHESLITKIFFQTTAILNNPLKLITGNRALDILSHSEKSNIDLFARALRSNASLTNKEKGQLSDFLYKNWGNEELNTRISDVTLTESLEEKAALKLMKNYTFRTRNFERTTTAVSSSMIKLSKIVDHLKNDQNYEPHEYEKLSYSEAVRLRSNINAKEFAETLNSLELDEPLQSKIKAFQEGINQITENFNHLETQYAKEAKVKSGVIGLLKEYDLFSHCNIPSTRTGKKWMQTVLTRTDATHAFSIYEKDNKIYKSHVYAKHTTEPISLMDYAFSSLYKLDFDKLVNPKSRKLLESIYGEEWKEVVEAKYQELSSKLLNNHFKALKNDAFHMVRSMTPKYDGYFNLQFSRDSSKPRNIEKMETKMKGESPVKMFCSEFVVRTTDILLNELNKNLLEAVLDSKQEDPNSINNPERIVLPLVPEDEFMKKQHPGSLEGHLLQKAFLLPQAPILSKIFKSSRDNSVVKGQIIDV